YPMAFSSSPHPSVIAPVSGSELIHHLSPEQQARLKNIGLVALDVDGVLTGGEIIPTTSGEDLKYFNAKDGLGIRLLLKAGITVAWITGRQAQANTQRANEVGVKHLYQNTKNKVDVATTLANKLGLTMEQVVYMGDDLPDIPLLEAVGFATSPADAAPEVRAVCDWVCTHPG